MLELVFAALLPLLPAEQAQSSPAEAAARGPILPARSFSQIFTLPEPPADAKAEKKTVVLDVSPQPRVRKKVVCGMTILIVDGSLDPKMVIAPKGGRDVDPGMPRVPKPMCGEKDEKK